MLHKRIDKISPYFQGMEITNGVLIVKVIFEEKWGTFPSEDERVKVAASQEVANEWFYYADYSVVPMDEVFDLIEETIAMNKSAAAKLELLSTKFEELKLLFSKEPLEKLLTLEFVMKDITPKKNAKKKTRSKKRKSDVEQIPQEDELPAQATAPLGINESVMYVTQ